ncbi:MAG: hypothetical protein RIQ56_700 [Candidatus Parcubacteria bacterium]|jgi:lipase chaperone LimK
MGTNVLSEFLGDEYTDVIAQLEIADGDQKFQEETLATLGDTVLRRVILSVAQELSETDRSAAVELLQQNKFSELVTYLRDKIPDVETLVSDTALEEIRATIRESKKVE